MNAIKETLAFTLIGFSILEVTKDLDHLRMLGLLLGATSQTPIFFTISLFIFGFSKRSELQMP